MKSESKSDLLYGTAAIATYVAVSQRQAQDLIARKGLPCFKLGHTVCASRAAIDAWIIDKAASANVQAA
jgi:excisionase family DNA binding protein